MTFSAVSGTTLNNGSEFLGDLSHALEGSGTSAAHRNDPDRPWRRPDLLQGIGICVFVETDNGYIKTDRGWQKLALALLLLTLNWFKSCVSWRTEVSPFEAELLYDECLPLMPILNHDPFRQQVGADVARTILLKQTFVQLLEFFVLRLGVLGFQRRLLRRSASRCQSLRRSEFLPGKAGRATPLRQSGQDAI